MDLNKLKKLLADNGCPQMYIKKLSPNDNSKNQVHLGGSSWEILNKFPISEVRQEYAEESNRERFKASINFYWLNDDGQLNYAPKSLFTLYPKYPEIRFSGFLAECDKAPSELMTQRLTGRLLFLSISKNRNILGYVASPDSQIAQEFREIKNVQSLSSWLYQIDIPYNTQEIEILVKSYIQSLIQKLINYPARISSIEWRDMERIIAQSFESLGFNVDLTRSSRDGGKDIILEKINNGNLVRYFVEVKHWNTKKAGRTDVNKLMRVVVKEEADMGIFLSTSGYTQIVMDTLFELDAKKIILGNGHTILNLCRCYVKTKEGLWSPYSDLDNIGFLNLP